MISGALVALGFWAPFIVIGILLYLLVVIR